MEIRVHQVGSPEDLAFDDVVAVAQAIDLELDPGDPPTPRGELAGRWFAPAPDRWTSPSTRSTGSPRPSPRHGCGTVS